MSRKGAAARAYNQQVRAYNQYRQDVVNAVNSHMRQQIDRAVTRQQEQINAAVAEAQARQQAYAFVATNLAQVRRVAIVGIANAVIGAFSVVKGIRLPRVSASSRVAKPEAPHMRERSGSPVAAITFEKAPRH